MGAFEAVSIKNDMTTNKQLEGLLKKAIVTPFFTKRREYG
jgi:hypothetical protein